MSLQKSARDKNVVVNLGRPSLRKRLEAYYSLISPDILSNPEEWKTKFDLIYQKFGGSAAGEEKLAAKLSKKYGNSVRLLVVKEDCSKRTNQPYAQQKNQSNVNEEDYYKLKPSQLGSGVLDMISEHFDPVAALTTSTCQDAVLKANPWLQNASLFNHVGQCRNLLPSSDPLHLAQNAKTAQKPQSKTSNQKEKKLPAFAAMAELFNKGPLSLLHRCMNQRQRVRVVIRYVNGIRGTLTGYLVAFDKHMNMIMRDVDEVYCPRHVPNSKHGTPLSNVEVELQRRIRAQQQSEESSLSTWSVRQRHSKQLLVRGDNVVLVYRAEQEQSVWPPEISKSPKTTSQHGDNSVLLPEQQRVGTPGSLVYALQQRKRSMSSSSCRKKNYSSRGEM